MLILNVWHLQFKITNCRGRVLSVTHSVSSLGEERKTPTKPEQMLSYCRTTVSLFHLLIMLPVFTTTSFFTVVVPRLSGNPSSVHFFSGSLEKGVAENVSSFKCIGF